jgi:competence protein ComEC
MLNVFVLSVVGLFLVRSLPPSLPWTAMALVGLGLGCVTYWFMPGSKWIWVFTIAIPCMAGSRQQTLDRIANQDRLHTMSTGTWNPVVVEAIVESAPRYRPNLIEFRDSPRDGDLADESKWETLFEAEIVGIRDGKHWRYDRFGRMIIASKGRLREFLPGDRLRCFLEWQQINEPTNPGQFNLAEKYRRQGIFVRGRTDDASQIEKVRDSHFVRFDRWLAWIVIRSDVAFHRYVPFGQATMASALVLGQRDQVEWEMQESLLKTGTIHMLAISGMHIEMVAVSIFYACLVLRVPKRFMFTITMFIVIVYSLLCGGNPPVARAAIVVVTLCICRWIGKTTRPINLLGLAGVVILLYRPSYWLEIGTQLSFLAVMVLILLQRGAVEANLVGTAMDSLIAETHSTWRRGLDYVMRVCRELLHSSFWVWWLTTPLVLFRFHIISPIAVVLNLVLWIPLLLALLSGLALLALSWCGPWLGYPIGWFCGVNLVITDWVVRRSADISVGHFWVQAPSLTWLAFYYLCLFVALAMFGFSKTPRKWLLLATGLWMATIVWPFSMAPSQDVTTARELSMNFIDVGHGTCILIRTPSGKTWLYDAGRLGNAQRSYQGIADVLWHERISKIDGLFLSHADSDHFNAIPGLLKRFSIGRLITTKQTLLSESQSLKSIITEIKSRRIQIECQTAGAVMEDGDVRFSVLHPTDRGVVGTDNANSLCLQIEYLGHRILLPGDLEKEGMAFLTSQPKRRVDMLMAPHHGSLAEKPDSLLEWCDPETVVISGGTRTRSERIKPAFGSPERTVLVTAQDHAIRCRFRSEGEQIFETWRYPEWRTVTAERPAMRTSVK